MEVGTRIGAVLPANFRGRSTSPAEVRSFVQSPSVSEGSVEHMDQEQDTESFANDLAWGPDRWLPITSVARTMRLALPKNAKLGKDAKECMQACVSEFISFITSEAADICVHDKRKTIGGDGILRAMNSLGFENYAEALKIFLARYREETQPQGSSAKEYYALRSISPLPSDEEGKSPTPVFSQRITDTMRSECTETLASGDVHHDDQRTAQGNDRENENKTPAQIEHTLSQVPQCAPRERKEAEYQNPKHQQLQWNVGIDEVEANAQFQQGDDHEQLNMAFANVLSNDGEASFDPFANYHEQAQSNSPSIVDDLLSQWTTLKN
ncbi:MAG: hypothetical protein Q9163_004916 [Psora crenata]